MPPRNAGGGGGLQFYAALTALTPAQLAAALSSVKPASERTAMAARVARLQLLKALLHRDADALPGLLAAATPAALASTEPMSVFHAAALSGYAEAIPQLVAAGAPIKAAEFMPVGVAGQRAAAHAFSLLGPPPTNGQRFITFHGHSALAAAAVLAHVDTAKALLEAGAAVDVGTKWYTPLEMLAPNVEDLPASDSEAMVRLLLEHGADVTRMRLGEALEPCCQGAPATGRLLLGELMRRAETGEWMADPHSLPDLMMAAAVADAAEKLAYWAEEGDDIGLRCGGEFPSDLLLAAAKAGANDVLRLAAKAAGQAVPDTPAGEMLGMTFDFLALELLEVAAEHGKEETVDMLLEFGACVSTRALCAAVRCNSSAVLARLLAGERQKPEPLHVGREQGRPLVLPFPSYPCPLLTALRARVEMEEKAREAHKKEAEDEWEWTFCTETGGWKSNEPDSDEESEEDESWKAGPTPLDLKLLPLVEQLRAAGYRPASFKQVWVRQAGGQAKLVEDCDPVVQDEGLEAERRGRYLWQAMKPT